MKVVNLCVDDWANFSYDNCQAMQSVGIDAYSYKLRPHVHNFKEQSEICSKSEMIKACQDADFIQIVHNNANLFREIYTGIKNKKINVVYTGTDYRVNHVNLNAIFNPYINKSAIALGEFAGLGAKNEVYMVGAVRTGYQRREIKKPYLVAHYPSNPEVKGTKLILETLKKFKHFKYSLDQVNANEQLTRLMECDIYVELLAPLNNGKKYGSWGITALEAAAMGKIVITQNLSKAVYEKHYGECPLILIENQNELLSKTLDLITMSEKEINLLSEQTMEWLENNHSYKATGEYMLKNILI